MGLLDFFGENADDPRSGQILGLAQGLLSAPGAKGWAAGIGGMNAARESDAKAAMLKLQMDHAKMQNDALRQQAAQQAAMQNAASSSVRSPGQANAMSMGPTESGAALPQVQSGFDAAGYTNKMFGIDPAKALAFQQAMAKESQLNKIDPKDYTPASVAKFAQSRNYGDLERMDKLHFQDSGGTVAGLNPFTGAPVSNLPKTGDQFKDLVVRGADGSIIPNAPLVQAKKDIAKSGASNTNVSVNTEKSLLSEIAGGIGKQVTGSVADAQSAATTINTTNRLKEILNSKQLMSGPGTSAEMLLTQIGSKLGVAGKDASERLANTRGAMQQLASLELEGSKAIQGQGPVTDNERALIKRASGGDINMTKSELSTLANALDKSARYRIEVHNKKVQPLLTNPNAAPLSPFLTVQPPAATSSAGGDWSIKPIQ